MMIVPAYWAEARLQARFRGRPVVVRRFGWSDEGPAEAQVHADRRANETLNAILAGQVLPRREVRSNYGVEGVPIREQIVQRDGDVIITRNSYGALCLNTPDVLFADIDHAQPPAGCVMPAVIAAALLFAGAIVGTLLWHWLVGVVLGVAAVVLVNAAMLMQRRRRLAAAGAEGVALQRVVAFSEQHPDWHLRAYRTPAGLRVLVMHATFSPEDEQLQAFFKALGTDALYAHVSAAALLPCATDTEALARRPEIPHPPTGGRVVSRTGQQRTVWPGLPNTKRRALALPRAPTCAVSVIPRASMPRPSTCVRCTTACRTRRTVCRWRERSRRSISALYERLPCQGGAQPHRDLLPALFEGCCALLGALLASNFRKALE